MASTLITPASQTECFCRREAYQLFTSQLPVLHTTAGLMRAAIAVSLHALDDVDPLRVEQRLAVLSLRVLERSPSKRPAAILANLHTVLFEEEGFTGDMPRYYNALNSYLPAVLNTRHGIPVLLSLLYKLVAEGAGLQVLGVNAPGHFMVRVACDRSWMIVDPFFAEDILQKGRADLVAIAREALVNPCWPQMAEIALGRTAFDAMDDWPVQYGWWLKHRERSIAQIRADETAAGKP